jgi:uroporphyrinogen-III decarboxylase
MVRAKDVLGGHLCITGGMPASLLQTGTVPDVEEYCRKLIDVCGKDGGFILVNSALDEATPANVKAMADFSKSYGIYA